MLYVGESLKQHLRKLGEHGLSLEVKDGEYREIEKLLLSIPKDELKCCLKDVDNISTILRQDLTTDSVNIVKHVLFFLSEMLDTVPEMVTDKSEIRHLLIVLLKKNANLPSNTDITSHILQSVRQLCELNTELGTDDKILKCVLLTCFGSSSNEEKSVRIESLLLLKVLLEKKLSDCQKNTDNWLKILINCVFDREPSVRKEAISTFNVFKSLLRGDEEHLDELATDIIRLKYAKFLKEILPSDPNWAVIWRLLVEILGKRLHSNSSLVNALLSVEEIAFKSSNYETKKEAFSCWKSLIYNFGSDHRVLATERRVKLITIPLRASNCRSLEIAYVKFDVWWYVLRLLKSDVSRFVEYVFQSFLKFCYGPFDETCMLFANGQTRLPASNIESVAKHYPEMRMPCLQALTEILTMASGILLPENIAHGFIITRLIESPLKGCQDFCVVSRVLTQCVGETMLLIDTELEQLPWIIQCWKSLLILVNKSFIEVDNLNNIDSNSKGITSVSLVKDILRLLAHLVETVTSTPDLKILGQVILSMIECLVVDETALPSSILNSHVYAVGSSQVMNGTPTLLLTMFLLSPAILNENMCQHRFMDIFSKLLALGFSGVAPPLPFARGLLKKLDPLMSTDSSVLMPSLQEIWVSIVNHISETIGQGASVSEGNDAVHDFQCIYGMLMLPIVHLSKNECSKESIERLGKPWRRLFELFFINSQLVITTQSSEVIEELCRKIIGVIKKTNANISYISQLLEFVLVIYSVNFYENSWKMPKSPVKGTDFKGDKNLSTSNSQQLLLSLFMKIMELIPDFSQEVSLESHSNILLFLEIMFTNATRFNIFNSIIEKSCVCMTFYLTLTGKNLENQKSFKAQMVKLWKKYLEFVEKKITHAKEKMQLSIVEIILPLLEQSFKHPVEEIVELSKSCWIRSLGQICMKYEIPDSLTEILDEVLKDMSPSEDVVVMAKPSTLKAGVSPRKVTQESSTSKKVSSPKQIKPPSGNDVEFKVIPPRTRAPVLTEHQKEKMKSRREDIPALYQDLTQDSVSQFSQQNNTPVAVTKSVPSSIISDIAEDANPPFQEVIELPNEVDTSTEDDPLGIKIGRVIGNYAVGFKSPAAFQNCASDNAKKRTSTNENISPITASSSVTIDLVDSIASGVNTSKEKLPSKLNSNEVIDPVGTKVSSNVKEKTKDDSPAADKHDAVASNVPDNELVPRKEISVVSKIVEVDLEKENNEDAVKPSGAEPSVESNSGRLESTTGVDVSKDNSNVTVISTEPKNASESDVEMIEPSEQQLVPKDDSNVTEPSNVTKSNVTKPSDVTKPNDASVSGVEVIKQSVSQLASPMEVQSNLTPPVRRILRKIGVKRKSLEGKGSILNLSASPTIKSDEKRKRGRPSRNSVTNSVEATPSPAGNIGGKRGRRKRMSSTPDQSLKTSSVFSKDVTDADDSKRDEQPSKSNEDTSSVSPSDKTPAKTNSLETEKESVNEEMAVTETKNDLMKGNEDVELMEVGVKEVTDSQNISCPSSSSDIQKKSSNLVEKIIAKDSPKKIIVMHSSKIRSSPSSPKHKHLGISQSLDKWLISTKRENNEKSPKTENEKQTKVDSVPKISEGSKSGSPSKNSFNTEDIVDCSQDLSDSSFKSMTKKCAVQLSRMPNIQNEIAFIPFEGKILKCNMSPSKAVDIEGKKNVNAASVATNLFPSPRSYTGRGARMLNLAQGNKDRDNTEEGLRSPMREMVPKQVNSNSCVNQESPLSHLKSSTSSEESSPPTKRPRHIRPIRIDDSPKCSFALDIGKTVDVVRDGEITLHNYSPTASPKNSSIKRKKAIQEAGEESVSPASKKARRVSFADPIVSKQVEFCIPESERKFKKGTVYRCLRMFNETVVKETEEGLKDVQNSLAVSLDNISDDNACILLGEKSKSAEEEKKSEEKMSDKQNEQKSAEERESSEVEIIEEMETEQSTSVPKAGDEVKPSDDIEIIKVITNEVIVSVSPVKGVTQEMPGVIVSASSVKRVTQEMPEVVVSASPVKSVTQEMPEVIVPASPVKNVTQEMPEVIVSASPVKNVTQMPESDVTAICEKLIDKDKPAAEPMEIDLEEVSTKEGKQKDGKTGVNTSQNLQQPDEEDITSRKSSGGDKEVISCTEACPSLRDCRSPVSVILPRISSLIWRGRCRIILENRGIKTVGELARLKEVDIAQIPLKPNKWETLTTELKAFEAELGEEASVHEDVISEEKKMEIFREMLSKIPAVDISKALQEVDSRNLVMEDLKKSTSSSKSLGLQVYEDELPPQVKPSEMMHSLIKRNDLLDIVEELTVESMMPFLKCIVKATSKEGSSSGGSLTPSSKGVLVAMVNELMNESKSAGSIKMFLWLFQKFLESKERDECIPHLLNLSDVNVLSDYMLKEENISKIQGKISPTKALEIAVDSLSRCNVNTLPWEQLNKLCDIIDKSRSPEELVDRFTCKIKEILPKSNQ